MTAERTFPTVSAEFAPDGTIPTVSAEFAPVPSGAVEATAALTAVIPDDLSNPEFLKRELPAALRPAAEEKAAAMPGDGHQFKAA